VWQDGEPYNEFTTTYKNTGCPGFRRATAGIRPTAMNSSTAFRVSLILTAALVFGGCIGGDGKSGSNGASKGHLNYHGFSGLDYRTSSQSGRTGYSGEFRYYPGETLEFRVGDLLLAEDVPAGPYVTLLEFLPDVRSALSQPSVNSHGLSSHVATEQQLLQNNVPLINLTRLLLALNWSGTPGEDEGIVITQRVIDQINGALPYLSSPIDFNVSEADFTRHDEDTVSPANQLLAAICFYPQGHELCEPPPTLEEIANAPPRPEDPDERDPDTVYSEELQAQRQRILNSIRTLDDIEAEDARIYLTRELDAITTTVSNRYYLDHYVANHPASDTAIKTLSVRRIAGTPELADLEAVSTRPADVTVHATDWQSAQVNYYVSGDAGGESELLLSFRPEKSYRWVHKSLRVIIDKD